MSGEWRGEMDRWFHTAAGQFIVSNMDNDPVDFEVLVRTVNAAYSQFSWAVAEKECGSPLEAILLAFLLFATDGYNQIIYDMYPGQNPTPDFGVTFRQQVPVGKYRVDFLITAHCLGKTRRLVVECDGHDFHDRTKEQAQHDKSRDRALVAEGLTVVRYTGSEIFKDPSKCVEEIECLLHDLMREAQKEAGDRR